jgi:DNA-binding NarL/FixJ family response regulator
MAKRDEQPSVSVRVCVADTTRMSSQLIASALNRRRNNFEVRPIVGGSSDVFQSIKNFRPHVALISGQLQDGQMAGFRVLHQLRVSNLEIPAVLLLDVEERDLVVDAFRAGARGVFCRGNDFDNLPKCIRRVHEGQIWISNAELAFLLEVVTNLKPFQLQASTRTALLTPRERDVVRLVAEGMRNHEIGDALNLEEHTVRNYIFRVFDKLGLSSRVELVLYALNTAETLPQTVSNLPAPARTGHLVARH